MNELETITEDKILRCVECGNEFVFEAGEQSFFRSKGLQEPKRCLPCRRARKATINKGAI